MFIQICIILRPVVQLELALHWYFQCCSPGVNRTFVLKIKESWLNIHHIWSFGKLKTRIKVSSFGGQGICSSFFHCGPNTKKTFYITNLKGISRTSFECNFISGYIFLYILDDIKNATLTNNMEQNIHIQTNWVEKFTNIHFELVFIWESI